MLRLGEKWCHLRLLPWTAKKLVVEWLTAPKALLKTPHNTAHYLLACLWRFIKRFLPFRACAFEGLVTKWRRLICSAVHN